MNNVIKLIITTELSNNKGDCSAVWNLFLCGTDSPWIEFWSTRNPLFDHQVKMELFLFILNDAQIQIARRSPSLILVRLGTRLNEISSFDRTTILHLCGSIFCSFKMMSQTAYTGIFKATVAD